MIESLTELPRRDRSVAVRAWWTIAGHGPYAARRTPASARIVFAGKGICLSSGPGRLMTSTLLADLVDSCLAPGRACGRPALCLSAASARRICGTQMGRGV